MMKGGDIAGLLIRQARLRRDWSQEGLCQGICAINTGIIFMDALTHLERAADQCSSIAMTMLAKNNEAILNNHHNYLAELHASGDQSYVAEHENRRMQYLVPLENME